MAVAADEGETHVGGDAETLVDETASLHASGRADGAEPVDVVLEGEQTAGGDEGSQHVVVLGHGGGLGGVGVQVLAEPHVLADDLARGLDVLALVVLVVRDTPAGGTAGAGLLREGKGDTVGEGTDDEGTLAVSGATRGAEPLGVDTGGSRAELLETVDDAVDTPGPGGQGAGGVGVAEEGVESALATGLAGSLRGEVVVVESDGADGAGDGERGAADGDDGGARGRAGLLDGGADSHRLGAYGNFDVHGAARERSLDLVGRRGVRAQLVLL